MAIHRSSRFKRIKKPLKSEMNVVPYIDVMLVLLVIFMVTTPMITAGVKVDLPQANNSSIASQGQSAIVSLEANGQLKLRFEKYQDDILSLDEISTILTEAQSQLESTAPDQKLMVMINGDQSRSYGDVMKLMSTLQDAGLTQVGLLTQPIE